MAKRLRFLIIVGLVALLGAIGFTQARASDLYGVCDNSPAKYLELKGNAGTFYYGVAYEIYDTQAGASSIHARLAVRIDHALSVGDTLNIWLDNAKFNQDQTVYYALVVDNESTNDVNAPSPATVLNDLTTISSLKVNSYTAAASGRAYRIAAITSSTISSPTDSIALKVDNATDLNKGKFLYLVQVTQPTPNVDNYDVVSLGSGIQVDPGLDASCSNYPEILIHFTAPNDSASNKTFAKIEPKCGTITVGANLLGLRAELNTDTDFTTFLGGPHVVDTQNIETCEGGCGGSTCNACNGNCPSAGGGGEHGGVCEQWIVGNDLVCANIIGSVSFTLTSAAPEENIVVSYGKDQNNEIKCTANTNNTQWTCKANQVSLVSGGCLHIKVDGKTTLNPTDWTISDLVVVPQLTSGINHVCTAEQNGDAGAWFGGLEALVPFVKSGNGYETYIKLFNRYDKDAKVFAATFKNGGSGSVMIALTQVATIPAGGEVQLTGAELASKLGLTSDEIAYGIPVKFMIMVPSQKGCINFAANEEGISGCYNNPNDPYVEGIVVSVTPQGQRSIPLEFKYFKNGAYNQ